ncbi:MAG: hypothetical protein U0414_25655 [Polyangiaceae bacterium]
MARASRVPDDVPTSLRDADAGVDSMGRPFSTLHVLLATLKKSLVAIAERRPDRATRCEALSDAAIERAGCELHRALLDPRREFHTHDHVLGLVDQCDPIQTLAALYHDLVYVHVDAQRDARVAAILDQYFDVRDTRHRVRRDAASTDIGREALAVFAVEPGQELTPYTGLNELSSALVFASDLGRGLTAEERVGVLACIEATIPFREDVGDVLAHRIGKLGFDKPVVAAITERAVQLANKDVANFAEEDAARFLDNTWRLLPETNPTLDRPGVTRVGEYRAALQKMEGFLSTLSADRVFHTWGREPHKAVHATRVARADANIKTAVAYLRAKLFSSGVLEAIVLETGGDVPIEYVMGALPIGGKLPYARLERFLPTVTKVAPVEPTLLRLLVSGRASASSFDTPSSPLAAFLAKNVGDRGIAEGFERAQRMWRGELSPFESLVPIALPAAKIAEAASNVAIMREDQLRELASRLRGAALDVKKRK